MLQRTRESISINQVVTRNTWKLEIQPELFCLKTFLIVVMTIRRGENPETVPKPHKT